MSLGVPGAAILFLTIGFALNAQYYSISYIQVPVEDQAEVARLETQYWSKVAKHNIEAGKQIAWGLVAAIGGTPNGWTHVFVNVYVHVLLNVFMIFVAYP